MKHDWICISPGMYDTLYECKKCGLKHIESIDNMTETALPKSGCDVFVHPIGTRIEFLRELSSGPTEDSPSILFAPKNGQGEIIGYGCWEVYWVKWDGWEAPFGCEEKDFKVTGE